MALHVNGLIPINLYFCFLSRMVVGSIEDLPGQACLTALPDPSGCLEIQNTMEIRNIAEIYDFVGPSWSVCLLLRSPIP
jgi:hypothetical protein